ILTSQPQSQAVAFGGDANFSLTASGSTPLSYQWFLNGATLAGATGASLNISDTHLANAGSYQLVVTNVFGAATSSVATLSVVTPPLILQQPANAQVTIGASAMFQVIASSSGQLTYQWFFGDDPIP